MSETLVIGAGGYLGKALHERLQGTGTIRYDYDLRDPIRLRRDFQLVYIVAAKTKFRDCELDEDAYATNVDGPIRIGAYFKDSFIVYISSEAATWPNQTAYGSQKRAAELGLLAVCGYERLAIVRPNKITQDRLNRLVERLVEIGEKRLCGVHRYK